jgi:two-component system, OmpR family, heavy metal sensor histidine kinase CusS
VRSARLKATSLTGRLTLWFTVSTFLLVLIATSGLYFSIARSLDSEDNLVLFDKVQAVAQLLRTERNSDAIRNRVEREWVGRKSERVYVKVLDFNGNAITETPGFEEISRGLFEGVPTRSLEHSDSGSERRETPSAQVYKVALVRIPGEKGRDQTLQIAIDRTGEDLFLATYRSRLLGVLLITFLITALIGRRIALAGMRPISDITRKVSEIRSTTLHQRLDLSPLPDELRLLGGAFNEMLDRLNESFDRLARFSQDIAHDLRNPINNLQGELEVALGRARSVDEYQDVLGSCLEECNRLSQLIDSLLFLARSEDPSAQLAIEKLNIRSETMRLIDFFEVTAAEKNGSFELDIPSELDVYADRSLFQRAVGNLITNAIRYAPGGKIVISARSDSSAVIIRVQDNGEGIPTEHLSKVFDRFYRVDPSRSALSGGAGLGLSIVKGIMTLHRGEVNLMSQVGVGTSVKLSFPIRSAR